MEVAHDLARDGAVAPDPTPPGLGAAALRLAGDGHYSRAGRGAVRITKAQRERPLPPSMTVVSVSSTRWVNRQQRVENGHLKHPGFCTAAQTSFTQRKPTAKSSQFDGKAFL